MARPYLQGSLTRILIAGLFLVVGIVGCGDGGPGKHHQGGGGGTTPTSFGVKQLGTTADDIGQGVAIDASGNIFVTGETGGKLDGQSNFGGQDIFLVKYNSSGTKQWTRLLGTTTADDIGWGVATDKDGNIFVTGETRGNLFGTTAGNSDIFLVQFLPDGTQGWAVQLGTDAPDIGHGVAIDASGNIFVTGETQGNLFGTTAGNSDIFLVQFLPDGTQGWAVQLGTDAPDIGHGVAIDASGNIFVTGETGGKLAGQSNFGGQDIFLVKYNSSGTKQWTRLLGTTAADDIGWGVATDKDGNIFVTGETRGNLFGTTAGNSDIFLVKFLPNGTQDWAVQFGTTANDIGWGVATDKDGNIFVTGETQGSLFDTNAGGPDIFLVKFLPNGTQDWAKQLGTIADDIGHSVAIDASGNIFVTGETQGNLGRNTNAGFRDIFLTKFDSAGVLQ